MGQSPLNFQTQSTETPEKIGEDSTKNLVYYQQLAQQWDQVEKKLLNNLKIPIIDKLPQQLKDIYEQYGAYIPPSQKFQSNKEMQILTLENESFYYGKLEDHKKQGFGYYLTQNEFFEGFFENDERKGWGRLINYQGFWSGYWQDGKIQQEMEIRLKDYSYKGQCKNSTPYGCGVLEKPEFIYKGQFQDGKKQGKGTLELKQLKEKYEGEFQEDKYQGKGTYYYSNGKRYEGGFKNNKPDGIGEMYWPQPEVKYYNGDFVNAKREGRGYFKNSDNSEYNGGWKNDKQHGFGQYIKDGIEIFGKWKDGDFIEDDEK